MPEFEPVTRNWERAYGFVNRLVKGVDITNGERSRSEDNDLGNIASILFPEPQSIYNAWYLAALVPWAEAPRPRPSKPGGKPAPPTPATVAREGVRVTNKLFETIAAAFSNADEVLSLQNTVVKQLANPNLSSELERQLGRDTLGMAIRKWGSSWRMQVLLTLLRDLVRHARDDASKGKKRTLLCHCWSYGLPF